MDFLETVEQLIPHVNKKTMVFDDLPERNKTELLEELAHFASDGKVTSDSKYFQAWSTALNMDERQKSLCFHVAYPFRVALTFIDLPEIN